jgi:hypothetical protein
VNGLRSALARARDDWLAATGLALALLAIALGLVPAGSGRIMVLVLRHAVPAGGVVRAADVVAVPIARSDRTPSMVSSLGWLDGRRSVIAFAGGDFVVRGALPGGSAAPMRRGERAVALEFAPEAAPDMRLLRRGRRVDVVMLDTGGSHFAARGLELLAPARERSGGIMVTVRAPSAVALALASNSGGRGLRLLLRGDGA